MRSRKNRAHSWSLKRLGFCFSRLWKRKQNEITRTRTIIDDKIFLSSRAITYEWWIYFRALVDITKMWNMFTFETGELDRRVKLGSLCDKSCLTLGKNWIHLPIREYEKWNDTRWTTGKYISFQNFLSDTFLTNCMVVCFALNPGSQIQSVDVEIMEMF
ncbi:hypothetical protein RF11_11658 [Thelohanellus kitauei]|uniref:Uncharacterized protein n=1 Tax=Thelohanellus kitauei TaxID=669202 RepID=A0A0C2ICW3_THEKT|nr:hypothetical protein RF11_11658 [Thelohanellus kitauei]